MSDTPTPPASADAPIPPTDSPRRPWTILGRLSKAVREQNWFAVVLEVIIVIVGVAIGFQVTAWGETRADQADAAALRAELREDALDNQRYASAGRTRHQQLASRAQTVLRTMAAGEPGPTRDSVLATIGSIFTLAPWVPVTDTYEEAIGSGRLALLTDPDLRHALSEYHNSLDAVGWAYGHVATQYYEELEPFVVAQTVYSEIAYESFSDSLVQAPFATDFDALAESRELWNLLTLRLEWDVVLQYYMDRASVDTAEVLALLDE